RRSMARNRNLRLPEGGLEPELDAHPLRRVGHVLQASQAVLQIPPRLTVSAFPDRGLAGLEPERRGTRAQAGCLIVIGDQLRPQAALGGAFLRDDLRDLLMKLLALRLEQGLVSSVADELVTEPVYDFRSTLLAADNARLHDFRECRLQRRIVERP